MEDKRYKFFMEAQDPDYVLEVKDGGDFLQISSSMGGDVHTHRVYGKSNGSDETFTIYER